MHRRRLLPALAAMMVSLALAAPPKPSIDAATAQSSWWVTTSPFIDKDDFER